jgi:uncharacterized protein YoxC
MKTPGIDTKAKKELEAKAKKELEAKAKKELEAKAKKELETKIRLGIVDHETKKDISSLSKIMSTGIKRWEKVIYPMMVAFILLSAYGFYLIVHVSGNMDDMSESFKQMNVSVAQMDSSVNRLVEVLERDLDDITASVKHMQSITSMTSSLSQMNNTLHGIYSSVYFMEHSTSNMSSNLSELNNNISEPLDSMNSVMPWSMFNSKKFKNTHNRYQPPPLQSPSPTYFYPAYNNNQSQTINRQPAATTGTPKGVKK